ncbi:MAG TPA: prolipoprotein diacylglyceryl transferase [Spirochaetota bacterium]|nr:prolipoprotein diacylglyceryl transferase [Spirochaetota bacterium]
MFPVVFQINLGGTPLVIGSYGIMLGIAFYCAYCLLEREIILNKKNPDLAFYILLAAVLLGLIGAKIFYIFENFQEFRSAPLQTTFSRTGLVVYGGLLLALSGCAIIIRIYKYSVIEVFDLSSPAIAVGFAFGRIGCHVSGDGCHGIEAYNFLTLPYPNGIVPAFSPVYPTSLFESFFYFIIASSLIILRKRKRPSGFIFAIFLISMGLIRFFVEFIRVNPILVLGLTQAQIIAFGLITTGVAILIWQRVHLKEAHS